MDTEGKTTNPRLGDFILESIEAILEAWEDSARGFWKGPLPDSETLRDHAKQMLNAVVEDMSDHQSDADQQDKSEGEHDGEDSEMNRTGNWHGLERAEDGFDIGRMTAEFRALRASVNRIWLDSSPEPHREQIEDMLRFNEALDQLLAASVTGFTNMVELRRHLFLGILGHDLRQPLQSLGKLVKDLGAKKHDSSPGPGDLLPRMTGHCDAMSDILNDLLDFASFQLGRKMPLTTGPADLEKICRDILAGTETTSGKGFALETSGDLTGEWDAARVRQLVSNLVSNARHHGGAGTPTKVTLRGAGDEVRMAVHNMGRPISEAGIRTLFDPMVPATKKKSRPYGSPGLELHICRQIVVAHSGGIDVESTADKGTTFTVRLPKQVACGPGRHTPAVVRDVVRDSYSCGIGQAACLETRHIGRGEGGRCGFNFSSDD